MSILLSFLIVCFFSLLGIFITRLMSVQKISLLERLNTRANTQVLKDEKKESSLEKLDRMLKSSRTGITVPIYFAIIVVSAVIIYLFCYFLTESAGISLIVAFASIFVPKLIISTIAKRNREKFNTMFVRALKKMSASMKAKNPLSTAVQEIAESDSLPEQITSEFKQLLADYYYNKDMYTAFMNMYERTGNQDVKGVATSIQMTEKYGSMLYAVLDSYAEKILQRQEMVAEGKAMLASTRVNTILIGAVPFAFGVCMKILQPDYFDYAYNWLGGLGKYIIILLYGIVVYGLVYLLKQCDIELD